MQNANTQKISDAGVSIWLDDLSRQRLNEKSLEKLITEKNVAGVTTNPSIFQAAISGRDDYDEQIAELVKAGANAEAVVRALTTDDVRNACDVFAEVYKNSEGVDGRVSIEVDPRLAHDGVSTAIQAKELFELVGRENVMIKIPAVKESIPAITETLGNGISVNVTLIFSTERYLEVIDAFIKGIELADSRGKDLSKIHSVASFFVSRVDTAIDLKLEEIGDSNAFGLRGKAAIANSRLAYAACENAFAFDPRWADLEAKGARKQRPLWASTGVKNPSYSPTLYVDELVGKNIVNTMPEATLNAVADHDSAGDDKLSGTAEESQKVIDAINELGIDFNQTLLDLETEGVAKFISAWTDLLADVQNKIN